MEHNPSVKVQYSLYVEIVLPQMCTRDQLENIARPIKLDYRPGFGPELYVLDLFKDCYWPMTNLTAKECSVPTLAQGKSFFGTESLTYVFGDLI